MPERVDGCGASHADPDSISGTSARVVMQIDIVCLCPVYLSHPVDSKVTSHLLHPKSVECLDADQGVEPQAAIPALMSGQIMAGAAAGQAAALQAVVLFCTAACAGLAAAAAVLAAAFTVVDGAHRVRLERLHVRGAASGGVASWVQAQLLRVRPPSEECRLHLPAKEDWSQAGV